MATYPSSRQEHGLPVPVLEREERSAVIVKAMRRYHSNRPQPLMSIDAPVRSGHQRHNALVVVDCTSPPDQDDAA